MATGRTVSKFTRFGLEDSASAPREIPVDSISPVGFNYDATDLTAYQDQVKGYLAAHPDCSIDITGPFSNLAAAGFAGSGAAPTLSGSHTVLAPISAPTFTTPIGLWIGFGVQGYWTAATDPAFGIITSSAINGYICTKYVVEGEKYSASFKPFPGSTPAWGTAILA